MCRVKNKIRSQKLHKDDVRLSVLKMNTDVLLIGIDFIPVRNGVPNYRYLTTYRNIDENQYTEKPFGNRLFFKFDTSLVY